MPDPTEECREAWAILDGVGAGNVEFVNDPKP